MKNKTQKKKQINPQSKCFVRKAKAGAVLPNYVYVYSINGVNPKKGSFIFYGNIIEEVLYVDNKNEIVFTRKHFDGLPFDRCDKILGTNNPYLISKGVTELVPGLVERFESKKDEIVSGTWTLKAKMMCCDQLMEVDLPEFIKCDKCGAVKANMMNGIQPEDTYLDVEIINK